MNAHRSRWFVLFALVAACATSDDDARPEGPLPDDAVFEETVVELSGETARVVSTRALTVGEARRDNTARAAHPIGTEPSQIVHDSGCTFAALWLYDRADGTGNRICFLGAGTAYLASHWRFADGYWQTWELGIGSVWPGVASGRLLGRSPDGLIDASRMDPQPYTQVWEFAGWTSLQAFYGLILYNQLTLDS